MPIRRAFRKIDGLKGCVRALPVGSELYGQGERCSTYFLIACGWIALSTFLDDGGCQILDFAIPGAFLGFPFLSSIARRHSARCITPVQVICYPEREFDDAIIHNSELAVLLCRQAVFDEWRAHDHLVNVGLRSGRERIAHLLLELCIRMHRHIPNPGDIIRVPLTEGHIGQAVGLTDVHVSRTLRTLREQGVARFVKRELHVLDPAALARAAGFPDLAPDVMSALDCTSPENSEVYGSGLIGSFANYAA